MLELPIHPKIVHIALGIAAVMPFLAVALCLAWWRRFITSRTWIVVVLLQTVLFGSALIAEETGEDEEDRVEHVVAHKHIEAHEDAAKAFVYAAGVTLIFSVLPLAVRTKKYRLLLAAAFTIGTVVVLTLAVRTGEAGGALIYKHGAARAYTQGGQNR